MDRLSQDLDNLVRRCTVRLSVKQGRGQGTGFFVAPGRVLTCAHVVEAARSQDVSVEVHWQDKPSYLAQIEAFFAKPYPDLALLRWDLREHPCVYLNRDVELNDSLYSFGYTDEKPNGDSAMFSYEGPTYEEPANEQQILLKLKAGQTRPGLSGAPLLNLRTGGVCGIVKSTRDRGSDLGGRAVPMACIFEVLKDLTGLQQQYHQQNMSWLDCLNSLQRQQTPWLTVAASNPFYGESSRLLGRTEEIRRILEKLKAGNHCSIVGPPGSGRTLLLRELRTRIPSHLGCSANEVCCIGLRMITSLKELQEAIVTHLGGQRVNEIRSLLRHKPLRVLMLDDLGGMETGQRGLQMRRWLRGLDDQGTRLVMVSNERLDVLFRKDDPNRDSPLAGLDPLPIELNPLPIDVCRQIVEQRLAASRFDITPFADLLSEPRQSKDLLAKCAARYEELHHSSP